MNLPVVAFIIPVLNTEKTIAQSLESTLSQNIEKEIIVVDNGSTDRTAQIIKKYSVKYIYEPKRGPAAAKNRGLKEIKSTSDFVAFVDSDVILPSEWAEKAIKILNSNKKIAGVGGPGKSIEKNIISEIFDYLLYGRSLWQKVKLVKSLATMNVIYKRKYIQNMFFNERLVAAEDADFNFRIIKKGYKLLYSNKLWVYHYNPTTIKQMIKKWFNYGKYYPLPYFWNSQLKDLGLWGRILYFPLILFCLLFSICTKNFILFCLVIFILPFLYFGLGIKSGIKNFYKLILFTILHSLKQLAQIVGVWTGIISRVTR